MPLSLMVVLIELCFFTKNALDIPPYFVTVPNGGLQQGTIILLKRSTSNFGEEVFMPLIDGEKSDWVASRFFSRRRFARIEVNIPVVYGLLYYIWFYSEEESDHKKRYQSSLESFIRFISIIIVQNWFQVCVLK